MSDTAFKVGAFMIVVMFIAAIVSIYRHKLVNSLFTGSAMFIIAGFVVNMAGLRAYSPIPGSFGGFGRMPQAVYDYPLYIGLALALFGSVFAVRSAIRRSNGEQTAGAAKRHARRFTKKQRGSSTTPEVEPQGS